MARESKFYPLETYLATSGKSEVVMTFSEIEDVLGFQMSSYLYQYPAAWSVSKTHSLPNICFNAGYKIKVDIPSKTAIFYRHRATEKCMPANKQSIFKFDMSAKTAVQLIKEYDTQALKDKHARYLSWTWCYKAFSESRNTKDPQTTDHLALHLAFYLASWGMYRGSSFLLQKDYKVHVPVVEIINEDRYNILHDISAEELSRNKNLVLLEEVGSRIRLAYARELPAFAHRDNNATQTLVTKILLGTLGCVPAYDRYFKQGIKKYKIASGVYSMASVRDIAIFYHTNYDVFESVRKDMERNGIRFPAMKLMDMCFWQAGFNEDTEKEGI